MVRRVQVNEIITQVTKTGTGAHCYVPKNWIGKKVKVILLES
jgi:putative transposon-encoded protein